MCFSNISTKFIFSTLFVPPVAIWNITGANRLWFHSREIHKTLSRHAYMALLQQKFLRTDAVWLEMCDMINLHYSGIRNIFIVYLIYLHVTSEKHFSTRDWSNVLFSCHPSRSSAHIKHILVCTAVDIRTAPGDHLSDCIGFASWKERKALFARGNNAIKSERGQQLWRQNWNNNFFLKAKRFFFL